MCLCPHNVLIIQTNNTDHWVIKEWHVRGPRVQQYLLNSNSKWKKITFSNSTVLGTWQIPSVDHWSPSHHTWCWAEGARRILSAGIKGLSLCAGVLTQPRCFHTLCRNNDDHGGAGVGDGGKEKLLRSFVTSKCCLNTQHLWTGKKVTSCSTSLVTPTVSLPPPKKNRYHFFLEKIQLCIYLRDRCKGFSF